MVDTDGGADDAMALLYLLQHPDVRVAAVTVTGTGLVHCPAGVANVRGLVAAAAPGADIPVACGPQDPMTGTRAFPPEWRDQADDRYGGRLPAGPEGEDEGSAEALLHSVLDDADEPVTLLTLGPLTTLAAVLGDDPGLAGAVERLVVMGGAFDVPGNVLLEVEPEAAGTEWNFYVDPAAAAAVLEAGAPITFVPLDTQIPVDPYVVRALAAVATAPPARAVAELLRSDPFYVSGQFFLWDPVAAVAAARPDLFVATDRDVTVVTDGPEAGRTVPAAGGVTVEIATIRDTGTVLGEYLTVLAGRSEPVALSRRADVTVGEGCGLDAAAAAAGPAVVAVDRATIAAVGRLEAGRTDAEIEAYLADDPTGPPPWFELTTLVIGGEGAAATFADLPPGELTVICLSATQDPPVVTGRATLTVTVPG